MKCVALDCGGTVIPVTVGYSPNYPHHCPWCQWRLRQRDRELSTPPKVKPIGRAGRLRPYVARKYPPGEWLGSEDDMIRTLEDASSE